MECEPDRAVAAANDFSNTHEGQSVLVKGDRLVDLVSSERLAPEWTPVPPENLGNSSPVDTEAVAQLVDGFAGSVPICSAAIWSGRRRRCTWLGSLLSTLPHVLRLYFGRMNR